MLACRTHAQSAGTMFDLTSMPFFFHGGLIYGSAAAMIVCCMLMQALNEESQIRDCVRSLRELDPPAHEILVVDGGSNDRCADLAHCFVLLLWQPGGMERAQPLRHLIAGSSMREVHVVFSSSSDVCTDLTAQSHQVRGCASGLTCAMIEGL